MAQSDVLLQLMSATLTATMTVTTISAAVASAVATQAVVTKAVVTKAVVTKLEFKAVTGNSAWWLHTVTVQCQRQSGALVRIHQRLAIYKHMNDQVCVWINTWSLLTASSAGSSTASRWEYCWCTMSRKSSTSERSTMTKPFLVYKSAM